MDVYVTLVLRLRRRRGRRAHPPRTRVSEQKTKVTIDEKIEGERRRHDDDDDDDDDNDDDDDDDDLKSERETMKQRGARRSILLVYPADVR